jgi:hypothetical protein
MFDPKVHECSHPLRGSAEAALDVARTALLALGFEIVAEDAGQLHALGPGLQSNRQPALLGASELHIRLDRTRVSARATLGGVATLRAFLFVFPPALALLISAIGLLSGVDVGWTALLSVSPWLVLSPWLAAALERHTMRAVDRLIHGMAGARAGARAPA